MTDETKDLESMTPEEAEAFNARLEKFSRETLPDRLVKILEDYLKEDPHLYARVLVDILRGSLNSLKHYIEDPEDTEISWENPWVESHFPVAWDWEHMTLYRGMTPEEVPEPAVDTITEVIRNGEDPFKVATDAVAELGAAILAPAIGGGNLLLLSLTNEIGLHFKDGALAGYFFANTELKRELDALPSVEERGVRMDALLEPWSIGGLEVIGVEKDGEETFSILTSLDHPEAVPGTLPPWAEEAEKKFKTIPKLTFTGEAGGVPFKGDVVIMIHPFVVNEDTHEAYFPIVTGLSFAPQSVEPVFGPTGEVDEAASTWTEVDPASWPEKDKEDLWKFLLETLPQTRRDGRGVPEAKKSAGTEAVPEPTPSALIPAGAPSQERRRTVGVAFGHTLASSQAMNITKDAYKVRLPKKRSTIPRWDALKEKEVQELLDEEGERAFEDLRKTTGDPDARGPLLVRRYKTDGKESVDLTAEARDRLKRRAGLGRGGFLDIDRYGQERLYRLFEVGKGGLLEVGLSWQGLAGPLVEEWRAELKRQAEKLDQDLQKEPALFADLDEERKRRVDSLLSQVSLWEDGRRIMEVILGQVGKQRRNPVEIPAEAFRVLLWPDKARGRNWPQNWKRRVEGALTALNALTFSFRTYRMEAAKGYGSMVGQWVYKGLGPGDHGDGVYLIDVSSGFIGCLHVFQSGNIKLRSGMDAVSFHFTKDLTKEERKGLGWGRGQKAEDSFVTFDAGRAFYSAAAGLTPTQENLLHFIESKITRRGDTARKGNKAAQVPRKASDSKEPRLYTSAFCSLLPEGQAFVGALGNFARNPEVGFTLAGSESRRSRHPGGLLHHMGHVLRSGAARAQRAEVITKALEDLKAVVVDHLGGIVAGHDGARWIPFTDFRTLDERTLTRTLRLFVFLPETWEEARRAQWEETTGRRATEDPEEAERETWEGEDTGDELGHEVASSEDGFRGWPLPRRLRAMMKNRGLRQKDLAVLFGVSEMTVSYWVNGKKKVPSYMEPVMVRWIESGTPPTAEELAVLAARRNKKTGTRKGEG